MFSGFVKDVVSTVVLECLGRLLEGKKSLCNFYETDLIFLLVPEDRL